MCESCACWGSKQLRKGGEVGRCHLWRERTRALVFSQRGCPPGHVPNQAGPCVHTHVSGPCVAADVVQKRPVPRRLELPSSKHLALLEVRLSPLKGRTPVAPP